MLARRFLIMSWITIVSLVGASACTPRPESEAGTIGVPSSATETASNQAQSSGEGVVVEVTPMSDNDLAMQPTGQSEPSGGSQSAPEAQPGERQPGKMLVYEDGTYKFKVDYPADFVLRTQPAEKLAQLAPRPVASFIFMNPVAAGSERADLEPADLEVRVHAAGQAASLDSWLTSNGLLAGGNLPPKPFQTAHVSGVELCASTMIAPGCSYYFMGNGWVYQLTPASLEGEAMVKTFTLVPSGSGPGSGLVGAQVPGMPNTGQANSLMPIAFALAISLAFIGAGTNWAVRRQRV